MPSRSLSDLQPVMQKKMTQMMCAADYDSFDVLFYCTLRTHKEQARLYRQGRSIAKIRAKAEELSSTYGRPDLAQLLMDVGPQYETRIITHAGPGQSLHNYGYAVDGVPLVHGKPVWQCKSDDERELWAKYGELAIRADLGWAGNWISFKEMPHIEQRFINWRDLIRESSL